MTVSVHRKEYTDGLDDVTKNRDAVKGERAIKDKRTDYLPPLPSMCCTYRQTENGSQVIQGSTITGEGLASYNKYLSLAYFYGASGRTVDGLTGLIFSKQPEMEIDPRVEYLIDNVDGKGNSLRKQSQKACEEAFITPKSGLLVDYPNVSQPVSVADAERSNLRPKILHYNYESIVNWHYDVVDNQQKLTLVVLAEQRETLVDRFKIEYETVYRVLEIIEGNYYQSVINESGEDVEPQELVLVNGSPVNEIPFFLIEVGSQDKSIINDLVDANLYHYRTFADYGGKLHYSSFVIYYETGAIDGDQNMVIGNGVKWSNQSTDATFGVLQPDGNADSHMMALKDMENRMAALGAEMLKPRGSAAESAEAKSLDQVAQNSTVSSVAINVSEAYEKALDFALRWMGGEGENVYHLSTDYNPKGLAGNDLTALVNALQLGAISYETFYENLQRGGVANPERTIEDEQAQIQGAELGLE
jgi:hypothetical protein